MNGKSGPELLKEHADINWRLRFAAYAKLIAILSDSFIRDTYTISDKLNTAVSLTDSGSKMMKRLITKEDVPAKEARLMCALAIGHDDLWVQVDEKHLEALEAAVALEISEERLRFPFIFGRDLYDSYAHSFQHETRTLSPDETNKLLDQTPRGVYQYGEYTLGPYGLRKSPHSRNLPASRRIPTFHCHQRNCKEIHTAYFDTSHRATINAERHKLSEIIDGMKSDSHDWWGLVREIDGIRKSVYMDQRSAVITPLVGDAFDIVELRELIGYMLDNTRGDFRSAIAWVGSVGSAADFTYNLDRAQVLQLLLFASDTDTTAALDTLIGNRTIVVPIGEVRRPVTNVARRSGAFQLQPEANHLGIRFSSPMSGFALLRERRLLGKLFQRSNQSDELELDWQLRGIPIADPDERLEHFYRTTDPRSVLDRLVLSRRSNMITACEEVGVDHTTYTSDKNLIDTLLWKLGFPVAGHHDPHETLWAKFQPLVGLTQSDSIGGADRFRTEAGTFFPELERVLSDSLQYTSWALLHDHLKPEAQFEFHDPLDLETGHHLLVEALASANGARLDLDPERPQLRSLILGFRRLAEALDTLAERRNELNRPESEFPEYAGKTELKYFAFQSRTPYLNLTPPSQERLAAGLREIFMILESADVATVRNDFMHYRKTAPEVGKTQLALEAIHQAIVRLETLGFCRMLFVPTGSRTDNWGRHLVEFAGSRSYTHTLVRPTRLDWLGMPSVDAPQYIMSAASFGETSEVLRFAPRPESRFATYWEDYPKRRLSRLVGSADATTQPAAE